jgi:hypothetical protein
MRKFCVTRQPTFFTGRSQVCAVPFPSLYCPAGVMPCLASMPGCVVDSIT